MKLFQKKEQGRPAADRTILYEADRNLSAPIYAHHNSLTTVDYYLPEALAKLEQGFDRLALRFLESANPDQFNGSYMTPTLLCAYRTALADLERQHTHHLETAENTIPDIWRVDLVKANQTLEAVTDELAEVEDELKKLSVILKRGTSLEDAPAEASPHRFSVLRRKEGA